LVLIGISRLLGADYRPTDNHPVPYRCISSKIYTKATIAEWSDQQHIGHTRNGAQPNVIMKPNCNEQRNETSCTYNSTKTNPTTSYNA